MRSSYSFNSSRFFSFVISLSQIVSLHFSPFRIVFSLFSSFSVTFSFFPFSSVSSTIASVACESSLQNLSSVISSIISYKYEHSGGHSSYNSHTFCWSVLGPKLYRCPHISSVGVCKIRLDLRPPCNKNRLDVFLLHHMNQNRNIFRFDDGNFLKFEMF